MGELIQIKEPRKLKTLLVKNKLFRFLFLNPLFCLYTKLTSQTQGSESVPPALSRGAWQCLGVAAFCRCAPPSLTFESLKSSSRCQDRVRSWSGLDLSDRKISDGHPECDAAPIWMSAFCVNTKNNTHDTCCMSIHISVQKDRSLSTKWHCRLSKIVRVLFIWLSGLLLGIDKI